MVQSAGVPIHYELVGEGRPIVLVHGFASSFEGNWGQSGWIDFLVARGNQVLGVDCRGHGRSGKPHDPAAYEGSRVPDDILAALDDAALDRVDIMGYSMGGGIVLNLLARFSDRFNTAIVGGAGLTSDRLDQDTRLTFAEALETDDVSSIAHPGARVMRQFVESRLTDSASLAGLDNDRFALGAAYRCPGWFQQELIDEAALRRVAIPVLAVVGDKDRNVSAAQHLVETVPTGELVVLPGEDHLSAVRARKYKDAVASFLKTHSLSAA